VCNVNVVPVFSNGKMEYGVEYVISDGTYTAEFSKVVYNKGKKTRVAQISPMTVRFNLP
jgi:hypothetical protein